MESQPLVFYSLQLLCPLMAMLLAYGRAYQQRLQGKSGREIENEMGQLGPLLAAGFSIAFFWMWPSQSHTWTALPGLKWAAAIMLGNLNPDDPNYELAKTLCSGTLAILCAIVARLSTFNLNRRLVRQVPRIPVGKR